MDPSQPGKGMGDITLPPGVNPQNFGQLKFTTLSQQQAHNINSAGGLQGGAAGGAGSRSTSDLGSSAAADIDFDFNILANYLAQELQYGELCYSLWRRRRGRRGRRGRRVVTFTAICREFLIVSDLQNILCTVCSIIGKVTLCTFARERRTWE